MKHIKDYFMSAHDELIEEYLELNPNATESEAYEATADMAYGLMSENYAAHIDYLRLVSKEK